MTTVLLMIGVAAQAQVYTQVERQLYPLRDSFKLIDMSFRFSMHDTVPEDLAKMIRRAQSIELPVEKDPYNPFPNQMKLDAMTQYLHGQFRVMVLQLEMTRANLLQKENQEAMKSYREARQIFAQLFKHYCHDDAFKDY